MKILIIGNNSTVGKYLYANLSTNYSVFMTGRRGKFDYFLDLSETSNDLLDIDEDIDVIIHCAAGFLGDDLESALYNEKVNSLGIFKVVKLAQMIKCKHIVHISSIFSINKPENQYFNSYGLSKKHGEENLEFLCRQVNIPFTILRPSQIYDQAGLSNKHQALLYHIIDCAYQNKEVTFYGDKDRYRNFIYVKDIVKIIEKIILKKLFGIYSCVHPKSYRLTEIAEIAYKIFNRDIKIKFDSNKEDIPSMYIPEDFTLYKHIEYTPIIDLETGINKISLNKYKEVDYV